MQKGLTIAQTLEGYKETAQRFQALSDLIRWCNEVREILQHPAAPHNFVHFYEPEMRAEIKRAMATTGVGQARKEVETYKDKVFSSFVRQADEILTAARDFWCQRHFSEFGTLELIVSSVANSNGRLIERAA